MCIESIGISDISMLFYLFIYSSDFETPISLERRKRVEMFDVGKKSHRQYARTYLINGRKRIKIYTRFLIKIDY